MAKYTHTIFSVDANGEAKSVFVAHVEGDIMLRSNAATCTGVCGTPAYHARMLAEKAKSGYRLVAVPGVQFYRESVTKSIADVYRARTLAGECTLLSA